MADYTLYMVPGDDSSENAKDLATLPSGDAVAIHVVNYNQVPVESRPEWLRDGFPVLAHMRPNGNVWRGPVWQGSHVFTELRRIRPRAAEQITRTVNHRSLQPPEDYSGDGGLASGAAILSGEDMCGMTLSQGLPTMDEAPQERRVEERPLTSEETSALMSHRTENRPGARPRTAAAARAAPIRTINDLPGAGGYEEDPYDDPYGNSY